MSDKRVLVECLRATPWPSAGSVRVPEHHRGLVLLGPDHFLGQDTLIVNAPFVLNADGAWQEDVTQRPRMFRVTWEKRYAEGLPSVLACQVGGAS